MDLQPKDQSGAETAFKDFSITVQKVTETNLFPSFLEQNGFKKIPGGLYARNKEELICITHFKDYGWRYRNLKFPGDEGSLIQFIANRLHSNSIEINKCPQDLIKSAAIADNFYKQVVKAVRKETKHIPWRHFSSSSQQTKRRI